MPHANAARAASAEQKLHRLGLLGGTFDPIHRGHLALATYTMDDVALDQVWFIPSSQPPHKSKRPLSPPEIRWEMTLKTVAPFTPRFVAKDLELRRVGYSYTVDTLAEVRAVVGAHVELFWIIGRDNVSEIPSWSRPRELVALATIIAGGRPGVEPPNAIPSWLASRIVLLDGPDVDVSSTRIREQVRDGILDEENLPRPVVEIIKRERLYGYPG